jgi:hypothetical protein
MSFFDRLKEAEITTETGYIRKEPDEYIDNVQLCDRLRYALALEESEFYELFSEDDRKEFLFHILMRCALGGGVCQMEDNIQPYFEQALRVYKDFLTVFRDQETEEIKIASHVYQIKGLTG